MTLSGDNSVNYINMLCGYPLILTGLGPDRNVRSLLAGVPVLE
jgi:hypothetical protein